MKKIYLLLISMVIVTTGFYLLKAKTISPEITSSLNTPKKITKLSVEAAKVVTTPLPIEKKMDLQISPSSDSLLTPIQCDQFFHFATNSVEKILERLSLGITEEEINCFQTNKNKERLSLLGFNFSSCENYFKDNQNTTLKEECIQFLTLYRARALDSIYADNTDYTNMETTLLINKIFAQFLKFDENSKSFNAEEKKSFALNMRAMTLQLLNKMPDSLNSYKAHLTTHFIEDDNIENIFNNNELLQYIDQALELDPTNSELIGLKLFSYKRSGEIEAINNFIKKILKKVRLTIC